MFWNGFGPNVPKSKAAGRVSVAASGTGTSVPTPPKTGPANLTPPKSGGPVTEAPPVADRGYGTRPKGRPQSGDRVLQRFSPPVIVPSTPTQVKTSGPLLSGDRLETVEEPGLGSARSLSPPVKKMPISHFARPAPEREHQEKKEA